MKIQKMPYTFCKVNSETGRLMTYRYVSDWGSKSKMLEMRKLAENDANTFGVPIIFYTGASKKIIQPKIKG